MLNGQQRLLYNVCALQPQEQGYIFDYRTRHIEHLNSVPYYKDLSYRKGYCCYVGCTVQLTHGGHRHSQFIPIRKQGPC